MILFILIFFQLKQKYNTILSHFVTSLPSQIFPRCCLIFSPMTPSVGNLFFFYYYGYIMCVCMYVFVVCLYMISRLTTHHWTTNMGLHFREKPLFLLPEVSSGLQSPRGTTLQNPHLHVNKTIDFVVQVFFIERFLGKTASKQTSSCSGFYFHPPFECFLSHRFR